MLKETELSRTLSKEIELKLNVDAVVVGGGIMGLMIAKRLTDLGQEIVLLEPQPTLAYGASIKNHGWLHRGTAHAVSIKDVNEAKKVVSKLIYGYEYIKRYAPECLEDPFESMFALTQSEELAERATAIWDTLDVPYTPISRKKFQEEEPYFNKRLHFNAFRTFDHAINNRVLFKRLATDIKRSGAIIMRGNSHNYYSDNVVQINSPDNLISIQAGKFIHCTGGNIAKEYEAVTGNVLNISYWKSHLISLPRFATNGLIALDPDLPIVINHGNACIVNRAYDEIEKNYLDLEVESAQLQQTFDAVCYLYPAARSFADLMTGTACAKPSIKIDGQLRHNVNSQIFEPVPNHYFVLPGKMTEAPYVADELVRTLSDKLDLSEITERPIDKFKSQLQQSLL